MANSASGSEKSGDVFSVERIRRLVKLMNEHDLNEIDLREANTRIRIRRGGEQYQVVEPRGLAAPPARQPPAPAQASGAAAPPAAEGNFIFIKSPVVGTFYTSPKPGAPSFIKVGDQVGPDTTVCIVEAMKVMNEVAAEVSGRIAAVLVENEQPVEFDQPLFKVEPSA